jgi:wyosine [tRNA(Phe)-imidazoG37] synthetase (radical SAM superfamily)
MKNGTYKIIISIAILLWVYWLYVDYSRKVEHEVERKEASKYDKQLNKLKDSIVQLEARRDTIIDTMVVVQARWRERIVEVLKEGKIDTIEVPIYIPMQLDSCREVGVLAMKRLAIAERTIEHHLQVDSLHLMKIAILEESLDDSYRREWRLRKVATYAGIAVGVLLLK